MNHAAVVRGCVEPRAPVPFEHHHVTAPLRERQRTRQSGDARADDDDHAARRAARRMASTMLPASARP